MKRILCFGDSNTYGYKPDRSGQFNENIRWTGLLSKSLGDDYEIIKGQYKIEDDTIYILKHNGGSTKWVKFATIENLSFDNTISSKNARLVITNPFDKKHTSLSLYGNIVGENPSPI